MSYQVIARKWRPQIFEEVIGQEAITQTLRNAIEYERLHHAYLFSGARGVGKTTTARLLAKALNCQKTDKPNPTPCITNDESACVSCKEIAESRSLDVLEFDAASNTQVDKIRDLIIENINIASARDRFKIFIIDEVHMLSTSSFNALLKTLEEPPQNVMFIMATTELHKVPETILSRCQEFKFRTISIQKIFGRLKTIAEAEKLNISDDALREIARAGEGSMRDAQSSFDQVISFSGEKIETDDVVNALGIASSENLIKTFQAMTQKNSVDIIKVIEDLTSKGQDLRNFCRDFLSFIRDLLVTKMTDDSESLLDSAVLKTEELRKLAEPFSETDLIRFFNSLAETESKLRDSTQPRYILEIGLIKLVEMQKVTPIEKIIERLGKLETFLSNNETPKDESVEKKTLATKIPPKEIPFPVKKTETKKVSNEMPPPPQEKTLEKPVQSQRNEKKEDIPVSKVQQNVQKKSAILDIDSMPVKLEPISSEELEHIEDKWLDNTYEYKLLKEGDDLKIIKNGNKIIESLLNISDEKPVNVTNGVQQNGAATAPKQVKDNKALEIVAEMTKPIEVDETIPELPENPTQDELWEFAENHPTVKKIKRIFRGKLVKVEKER